MSCNSCKERIELLKRAREAYRRSDTPEVRRLIMEVFGTAVHDVDRVIAVVMSKLKESP
jgi:hypothetical protein